jgi:ketosteroid isomerase-like protein
MSDNAEQRGEMPVEYSSRLEGAWKRAIAEGDTGLALEAARAAQARFQHDGVDGIADLLDPDFELHMEALFLDGRVYRGAEGLRQWRRELEELFEYDRFDVLAVRLRGDLLVQIGRMYTKGKSSGVEVDLPFAYVVRTRVDKMVRLTMYSDIERALAEAGIS